MPVVTPDIPGAQTTLLPRIVQKASAVTSAAAKTLTCAFTNPNTTGNSIIVSLGMGEVEGSNIVLAVTDANSNTYTQAEKGSQSTTLEAAIFYSTGPTSTTGPTSGIVAGTNTITATLSGSSSSNTAIAVEIYEVVGLIAVTPGALDAIAAGSSAGATSVTTTAVVPLVPNELAIMAIAAAGGTITAGTNWTLDSGSLTPTGGGVGSFGSESQLLTTVASVSGAATLGTSNAYASALATFKTPMLAIGGSIEVSVGTVTANAGTNLNTSLLALEAGGNLAALVTNTADLLADGDFLTTISTNTGNIPAKGTAVMAGSTPVTIATNDTVLTGVLQVKRSTVAAYTLASVTTSGTTQNSGDITVGPYTEIALDINTTAQSGTNPTIQYFYERKAADGIYYILWQSAVLTAATNTLSTSIGAGMAYNQSLGVTGRLRWVIGGSNTPTFTHTANIQGK